MDIPYIAWFLLLAPLAASISILLHLHRKPEMAMFASVGSASVCFLIAVAIFFGSVPEPEPWTWLTIPSSRALPGLQIEIGMVFDALSKGMLLVVTGVGLLVHIFSIGYMAKDPGVGRFFGGLSIFMFSMTGIVVATNLIEMFFFWEGVGLSSYLLIGFWFTRESAAQAANKAFVCNRLADFGFMIGILTFWSLMGTVSVRPEVLSACVAQSTDFQIHSTLTHTPATPSSLVSIADDAGGLLHASPVLITVMVLGLFAGCVGKSAMFPLHVWLPDAMEGPTPVSALIHAATMVAAGVYMLCRVYPLLVLSEAGMAMIAFTGCFTAIFAATIALQQNDIKRILAYSTLSQLGYMVMAVGCGGPGAAMFHLTTHAFFKALLFLAAGSVIHALHEEQDIWKMGGLVRRIPLTVWTFVLGMLALIGFPFFSGFFSKDLILVYAYNYHPFFYWVGVITAFLTSLYMTRLVMVAFTGKARSPAAEHPHESPLVMTIPLVILAVLSVIGGFSLGAYGLKTYYHGWSVMMEHDAGVIPNNGHYVDVPQIPETLGFGVPLVMVFGGLLIGYLLYRRCEEDPVRIPFLAARYHIDEFYDRSIVGGQQMAANFFAWIDSWILDGFFVRGLAYLSVGVGELLRLFQTGSLQTYAFLLSLGGGLLVYFTLFAH